MTEPVYLGSHNAREIVSCKIEEHSLKHHPHIIVRVKQLPLGVLNRLSRPSTKEGPEGDKARAELITLSIVNEDGTPAFSEESSEALKTSNLPVFSDLMDAIGKANNKTRKQIDAEADDAEKN
jgi:hypothetical protein